jgi:hypothetical protein
VLSLRITVLGVDQYVRINYILLMHDDSPALQNETSGGAWGAYIEGLKASGCFQGGSSMGASACVNQRGTSLSISAHLVGFIRVRATDLNHARELLKGYPVFEAGGTVEIRELPKT